MEAKINSINLKTEALKNGAIWGVISLVIFLAVWYTAPDFMVSWAYSGISFVIGITLAIFFTLDLRKKAGGYWSFSEALWTIFVMFILAAVISYSFSILFGKFIDTSYPTTMKESIMAKTETFMKDMNVGDAEIEEALSKQEGDLDKQFNPNFGQAIVGFGITAIVFFIGALIFALIFKRSNPNPFVDQDQFAQPSS